MKNEMVKEPPLVVSRLSKISNTASLFDRDLMAVERVPCGPATSESDLNVVSYNFKTSFRNFYNIYNKSLTGLKAAALLAMFNLY